MDLNNPLIKLVKNNSEIMQCMNKLNIHVKDTFLHCYKSCFNSEKYEPSLNLKIDSVVDYLQDELNTGHWSEIPIHIRQAFTCATFIKALIILSSSEENAVEKGIKCIDMGLLLGAPLVDNDDLLTQSASLLNNTLSNLRPMETLRPKRKVSCSTDAFEKVTGIEVNSLQCPSVDKFKNEHFTPQVPVILKDCMSHWPASQKWLDLNYLLQVAGTRTVPIEIGSRYTDENWTQKLMPLKDFICNHYLGNASGVGYLAQHNLFDQITELRNDICIPDYCALSRDYDDSSDPDINAWFGPEGTVSPIHFDPKDNLLAQVYGTKQVLLFSPKDSENLYPHEDKLLFNTAQVDPYKPDFDKYPGYSSATVYKCLLKQGEMLYIPLKWWHHVTALDKSFSVSFWWK